MQKALKGGWHCCGVTHGAPAGTGAPASPENPPTKPPARHTPFNAFCIQDNIAGQQTGYTAGYCTSACGMGTPCVGGSVCITESFFGAAQSTCRAPCTQPGQQSTCRSGYVCQSSSLSLVPGFCRPRCDNVGALSACPPGATCNSNGTCP